MATNSALTGGWIKFLKNNQIVNYKSKPDGKLDYKRSVTTNDVIKFLVDNTHYSETQINNAVEHVITGKNATLPQIQNRPNPAQLQNNPSNPAKNNSDHNTTTKSTDLTTQKNNRDSDNITDIDFREIPDRNTISGLLPNNSQNANTTGSKRKPKFKLRTVKEDFRDTPIEVNEKQIEEIFSLLTSEKETPPGSDPSDTALPDSPVSAEQAKMEIDKIKLVIRDKMTDSQRKSLWRLLTDA